MAKSGSEKEGGLSGFFNRLKHGKEREAGKVQEGPAAGMEQAETVVPVPERPTILALSEDDPLSRLWLRWSGTADTAVSPDLRLERNEAPLPLTDEELTEEARRLYERLTERAQKRLQALEAMDRARKAAEVAAEGEQNPEPPGMDAECVVFTARNGMAAWAAVFPHEGAGTAATAEGVLEALKGAKVTAGVDESVPADLTAVPRLALRAVARGVPAVDGTDGSVVERVAREWGWEARANLEGTVDYRAESHIISIAAGDVLCDLIPPEPGTDGLRVTGEVVRAKPGVPAKAPMGTNTRLSEDGRQLLATMDGHVEFSNNAFQVKPSLEVEGDVDYSSGNIDFRGDVHIRGDVRANFTVRATGKILIDGLVEAATIEGTGDVTIVKGVLGEQKAVIRSHAVVRARYLENCTVFAGECVYADCIIASEVNSGGRISVQSGRGAVIGGILSAAERVEAAVIGTQSERKTVVILGQQPFAQEEIRRSEEELEAVRRELKELEHKLAGGKAQGGTPQAAKERVRRSVLAVREDKLVKKLEELEEQKPELVKCRLSCGTLYPGTEISIGSARLCVDRTYKHCTARYDEDEAEIELI